MKKTVVVTAIGKDRPGIVAAVSRVFFETGCNIEDSSMTILGNDFAMILMVTLPLKSTPALLDRKLAPVRKKMGLAITQRPLLAAELKSTKPENVIPYMISVYGTDKPGIVYRISDFLARNKVNITDVETKIISADENPVYVMMLEVNVPAQMNITCLSEALSTLAKKLRIDITINPIESYQL
jgi:glycine cleavage system transcriptional repressor